VGTDYFSFRHHYQFRTGVILFCFIFSGQSGLGTRRRRRRLVKWLGELTILYFIYFNLMLATLSSLFIKNVNELFAR
jgi:hypothetical protein